MNRFIVDVILFVKERKKKKEHKKTKTSVLWITNGLDFNHDMRTFNSEFILFMFIVYNKNILTR